MAGSETCTEYLITAEKRRISPPENSPNTKRRKSPPSDPSLITQLVDDPTIMGMAENLAGDLGSVKMAKELLSALLLCAGAERFERLVSLPIWHNQQLLSTLKQYQPLPTMEDFSPREDQHLEERMAHIMDHPSLKLLLGEKEDVSLLRGAIIIILAYWKDFDNEDETMEDVLSEASESVIDDLFEDPAILGMAENLARELGFVEMAKGLLSSLQQCAGADHLVSLPIWHNQQLLSTLKQYQPLPTMKETSPREDHHIEERMAHIMDHPSLKLLLGEKEDVSKMRGAIIILLAYWKDFENEDETMEDVLSEASEADESIIDDLFDHPSIQNISGRIEPDSGLGQILDGLLHSVHQSRSTLEEETKEHFKLVKMAWEDSKLISFLLKDNFVSTKIKICAEESNQQLIEELTPQIKTDPSMNDILRESKDSSVRGVLTLLIGYWSANIMIRGFDDVLGRGGAVGIDSFPFKGDDGKEEAASTCEGGALIPDPSLIKQLFNDESFQDVAQQIQSESKHLVEFTDKIREYLTREEPNGRFPPHNSLVQVLLIWQHPSLIPLRRALKKSPSLCNLFEKLSNGAQALRLKERLLRIRRDHFSKNLPSEFSLRMRVALSILIGYWSGDVPLFVRLLLYYGSKYPFGFFDWELQGLKDVEMIRYWAESNNDLEGLKNVLARKYAKDSLEFECRFREIEKQQKQMVAEEAEDYDNKEAHITALMKGGGCILMLFKWFSKKGATAEFIHFQKGAKNLVMD